MRRDLVSLLEYSVDDSVVTITMDDGKANALSPAMQAALNESFDRAEQEDAVSVVLAGREGRFCGGFDLGVLRGGGSDAEGMLRGGFELAARLLSFPKPLVVACTGHALAMGSFLVLCGDYRIGADGPFKIQANEVAIGLTMPTSAVAILRYRLTPKDFDRAVCLSHLYSPADAVTAGWFDTVVEPGDVIRSAQETAGSFSALDPTAHANSKLRARETVLAEIRRGIDSEFG